MSKYQLCNAVGDRTILDDGEGKALAEVLGFANKRDLLIAVGEGKVAADALASELAAVKGVRRRRQKKIDLPVPDKAEGWFALRATDMFRFRVPGNPRAGTNAKAALAQLSFSTPVSFSPEGIVPGDRLVGIMEPDGPIVVYPIHSDALVARFATVITHRPSKIIRPALMPAMNNVKRSW